MKTILASVLLITMGFVLVGCESDLPPNPKTEGPIERGFTGKGKIVPIDKKNDPMVNDTPGAAN